MNLNLNFSLIPPDPNSAQAGAQVIDSKGVPIGEKGDSAGTTIAKQLGWATKDTIEPAVADKIDEIIKEYGNINISVHVEGGQNGDPISLQFNSADPANPAPPINKTYLMITQNAVTQVATPPTTDASSANKPNPWLAGNVYVAFLECFMEMQRMLKESKMVEGNIEVKMMSATVQLAKDEAKVILETAELQRDQYIAAACMAGASVVISGVSLGMTCKNIYRVQVGAFKVKPPPTQGNPAKDADNARAWEAQKAAHDDSIQGAKLDKKTGEWKGGWSVNSANQRIAFWGSVGAFSQALTTMGTNLAQATVAVPVAELEGLKTMIQVYKQMMQHIMEKASEKFKQDTDQIAQLLSLLDSIRQKINDGLAGMLRKSS